MSVDIKLPFGMRPADGRMIHIEAAERGIACGLVCAQCKTPLVARKGDMLRHHFGHASECSCIGALETSLHRTAKQILCAAKALVLPEVVASVGSWNKVLFARRIAPIMDPAAEGAIGKFRADVLAKVGEKPFAIEVLVTHSCTAEKLTAFSEHAINAVEIDLSGFHHMEVDPSALEAAVTTDAPRRWLFHEAVGPEEVRMREWLEAKREREREAAREQIAREKAFEDARRAEARLRLERAMAEAKAAAEAAEVGREEFAARRAALTQKLAQKPSGGPQEPSNGDGYAAGLYAGYHKHMAILRARGA